MVAGSMYLGNLFSAGACSGDCNSYVDATMQEVEVYSDARSAAWIAAEYQNTVNTTSFVSVGAFA
jgi:hypothetical protein